VLCNELRDKHHEKQEQPSCEALCLEQRRRRWKTADVHLQPGIHKGSPLFFYFSTQSPSPFRTVGHKNRNASYAVIHI
jgi:hypothetical protein